MAKMLKRIEADIVWLYEGKKQFGIAAPGRTLRVFADPGVLRRIRDTLKDRRDSRDYSDNFGLSQRPCPAVCGISSGGCGSARQKQTNGAIACSIIWISYRRLFAARIEQSARSLLGYEKPLFDLLVERLPYRF